MEIKYTGMELKLHRHGIRTAGIRFRAMLIATPLVGDSALANGIVTGKVFWFHLSMALMAIRTVVTAWLGRREKASRLHCRTDCCSSLPGSRSRHTTGSSIPTRKLLFGGQLVVLWFLLRYFSA